MLSKESGAMPSATVVNLAKEPRLRNRLQHANTHGNTTRIDRRTRWGNPFRIGVHGTRDEVIARYRADLRRRIDTGEITLEELAALDGRELACWCDPLPCHGHVLARAAAWAAERLRARGSGPRRPSGPSVPASRTEGLPISC